MTCIKWVNRSALVAMAPDLTYMAAGTMAGAVDLSFSSSANIEIFKLDFRSDDPEIPVIGGSPSSERFNRLSWGRNGSGSEQYAMGLVAGGLADGSIDIWNPLALINPDTGEAHVGQLSSHQGPVRGLEFNPITANLLASGADDGQICIWDLATPKDPSHFPSLKGSGSSNQTEISFVSWNLKVQHILASTSHNGSTVVWDLKKQKPVITVEDSVRRRCSFLQWHPDVATQLVVASDEDKFPSLRLWDMRNTISPVKEFVGHTKGVLSMSWCPNDSCYLLTCAKDNRTICWNTISGEVVCELPTGTNWNFDVHWYPKVPGVISASSFDGKISIYNVEGCNRYGTSETDFREGHLRSPKWFRCPVGISFGFGGQLLSLKTSSSPRCGSEVFLHILVTEHNLVSRSSEFEEAIRNGEKASLRVLCDKKAQASDVSEEDREYWDMLKLISDDDGTARTKMLDHLGFRLPIDKNDSQDKPSISINDARIEDAEADNADVHRSGDDTNYIDNGEDFFDNLSSPKAFSSLPAPQENSILDTSHTEVQLEPESDEISELALQSSIERALVVGDYTGAVSICMSANRMADALVIAHTGGDSLWKKTCEKYLRMSKSPYLKIVSATLNNDLMTIVNSRPLKHWKETLALFCTYATDGEWTNLCNALAAKLATTGNTLPATICYICAGNIDKTVQIWATKLTSEHRGKCYVDVLQDLMEKTIVLALASGQKQFSPFFCKLFEKYVEILASQGLFSTAMEYLRILGSDDLSPEILTLRDQIASSLEPEQVADARLKDIPAHTTELSHTVADLHVQDQGIPQSKLHQNVLFGQHGEKYPAPTPYTNKFNPTPYQPAPPPHVLLPTQTPQMNFQTQHTPVQQSIRTFVPSSAPVLSNPEQYQAPTLASQLYPGTHQAYPSAPAPRAVGQGNFASSVSPNYQPDISQVTPPSQALSGFRPAPSIVQQPVIGSTPLHVPAQSHPKQTPPAATYPTIQTADTSNVSANQRPIVDTLYRIFKETSDALGAPKMKPSTGKELDDISKKIGKLFADLNSRNVSKDVCNTLSNLCLALDRRDIQGALQCQLSLTKTAWDECSFWLVSLKALIKKWQSACQI